MNAVDQYARQVMDYIPPAHPERGRIELDLRAHVEETVTAMENSPSAAFERMGEPRQMALGYLAEIPMHYAGVGRRVVAFVIDILLGFAIFGGVAAVGVLLFGLAAVGTEAVQESVTGGGSGGPSDLTFAVLAVPVIVFMVGLALLSIAYFPVLEWRFGQTLGKYLLGIHVVREDGLRPRLSATIVRRIPFFLEFFWIDAIVAFFTERKQRAFDLVARTVVVENRTSG